MYHFVCIITILIIPRCESQCCYSVLAIGILKIPETSNPALLPTMVFIHGGLFLEGSGSMYGPDYFMDEDVILVTLNYRLSALGEYIGIYSFEFSYVSR